VFDPDFQPIRRFSAPDPFCMSFDRIQTMFFPKKEGKERKYGLHFPV